MDISKGVLDHRILFQRLSGLITVDKRKASPEQKQRERINACLGLFYTSAGAKNLYKDKMRRAS